LATSPAVREYKTQLAAKGSEATIVRVDRLDPAKNILAGFQAYEMLLRQNPGLQGRVRFLAFLVPSRGGIEEYDRYAAGVFDLVARINASFGTPDWTPIEVCYEQNRDKALAALSLYDVLLVNSVADGMNLVSKEGPIINERNGVLVLSRNAGSYEELKGAAISIDPRDLRETAQALKRALSMKPKQRAEHAEMLRMLVKRHQLGDWQRHQMNDLNVTSYLRSRPQSAQEIWGDTSPAAGRRLQLQGVDR
ncbi:MAG TPA: trehalose-6-phosphate synthase, partial [Dehalococcoidia bacterium]